METSKRSDGVYYREDPAIPAWKSDKNTAIAQRSDGVDDGRFCPKNEKKVWWIYGIEDPKKKLYYYSCKNESQDIPPTSKWKLPKEDSALRDQFEGSTPPKLSICSTAVREKKGIINISKQITSYQKLEMLNKDFAVYKLLVGRSILKMSL